MFSSSSFFHVLTARHPVWPQLTRDLMWLCTEWLSRHRLAMRPRQGMMMSSLWDWLWCKSRVNAVSQMSEIEKASLLGQVRYFLFLHISHEKRDELMDVVCRLEDARVVRQFLQHLQTLNDTYETALQQMIYHWTHRPEKWENRRINVWKSCFIKSRQHHVLLKALVHKMHIEQLSGIETNKWWTYLQYQWFSWCGTVAVDDGGQGAGEVVAAVKNLLTGLITSWRRKEQFLNRAGSSVWITLTDLRFNPDSVALYFHTVLLREQYVVCQ